MHPALLQMFIKIRSQLFELSCGQAARQTLSELKDIFKYADGTTLLVPEHTDTELEV